MVADVVERSYGADFSEDQRLAFGRAADLYDEVRPGVPDAVISELILRAGLAAGDLVYEVGAGTGKGTVALARRGLEILAIEPSAEMVRVARRNCAEFSGVHLIETDLEHWEPTEPREALFSFQAWHWTRPEVRYRIAYRAVRQGGMLAAIWSFPDWDLCPHRERLATVYEKVAPDMAADFPMHPASNPTALAGDWRIEPVAGGLFERPHTHEHRWTQSYRSHDYARLLQTHQDHILLQPARQQQLLGAIIREIDDAGGVINLPLTTYICTAIRSSTVGGRLSR